MFEFLFNYRADLFSEGRLSLLAGPGRTALIALGGLSLVWFGYLYWKGLKRAGKTSRGGAALLLVLRGLAFAAILFALLEPSLSLRVVKAQENFVAVLADTSLSMTIEDTQNLDRPAASRAGWLSSSLGGGSEEDKVGPLWERLAENFQVRAYSYGEQVRSYVGGEPLTFGGRRSDLGSALERVRTELTGVPLAGIVVLTDGALANDEALRAESLRLRSAGVPVFPVAVGSPQLERDLEVTEVRVSPRTLLGSTVAAEVTVAYPGFSGKEVRLDVLDEGRVVESQVVELPIGGESSTTIDLSFRAQTAGTRKVQVRVASIGDANEAILENNTRTVLVEVQEKPHKILYFEGEPRFEYKFIRRAVADDPQLQLVSMLRMADNRFYRQSVDSEEELQGGFPTRREELFKYRGLVLGSVEASFFSYEQMRMIVDFAAERGGGVLFLGGARSLGEGGYAGTPLAELIPVELSDLREIGPQGVSVKVEPTQLGSSHSVLQFKAAGSSARDASPEIWPSLPELLVLNRTGRLKPGAAALLNGHSEALNEDRLVLAHQRFGKGSSMIFTPIDSFRWQMRLDLEDQTHEVLWQQLLRWLINGVDQRVVVSVSPNRVEQGEPVMIEARVRDARYQPNSNTSIDAEVVAPSGIAMTLPLVWDPQSEGVFRSQWVPVESGDYTVHASSPLQGKAAGDGDRLVASASFQVASLDEEFFGAAQQVQVLERLAGETGGQKFDANQMDALLDRLSYSSAGVTIQEHKPLWNMPALLFLMMAALFGEWTYRRVRGLR